MGKNYLCGHTGSHNRGCEAIVRSTLGILKKSGVNDCRVFSYAPQQDLRVHLDEVAPVDAYEYSHKIRRGFYRYVLRDPVRAHKDAYRRIVKKGKPDRLICIGGDTYCSDHPFSNYAINITGEKYGIPTVLWGCSVDDRVLTNEVLKADIQKYRHIVARESLTYDNLKQCITPEQTLWLACDPAFHLEMKEIELPSVFLKGDTIGINLSPYFIKGREKGGEMIQKNVQSFIRYLLEETRLNICFIPHVYNFELKNQDIEVLDRFYQQYAHEPRIGFLREDLSCTEIKYVISHCRFFVGARTHSVIAAYSTGVPALALSYSVKSLGIAKDIFGEYEGYALSKEAMMETDCLTDVFVKYIHDREDAIRARYEAVMPTYKQSIIDVAAKIFAVQPKE